MTQHRRTVLLVAVLAAVGGCGDDDGMNEPGSTGGIGTTNADTSTATATATSSDASSTGAATTDGGSTGGPDPSYPRPSPVDMAGECPPDAFGPITFDGGGWVCLPACVGDPPTCPDPATGDAPAQCATNPMSSAAPCTDTADCEVEGEMCGNVGDNERGCLLPPSHCILRCDEGQTCPDGMSCAAGPGICQYEP